ncbi:MAG: tetratricopeptide repeat protein [Acidobacteria bacterium]|nr:tetratricopeptide repeat protein [Acidobacteriota bacterium]
MRRSSVFRLALVIGFWAFLAACSRDPAVRKQKYFESGERYFAKGKYREAIIQFRNATEVDSSFSAAHYRLAETYLKLQDGQQAYTELGRTLELDPENSKARIDLANLLILNGQLNRAREHTDWLREKQAGDPDAHIAIAHLLEAEQKFEPAIAEVQKAIRLAPDRGDLYLALAVVQSKANLPDAAEANFKKAVELRAKGNPRIVLAAFYESRGRYSEAEHEVQRIIAAEPKNSDARASLAKLYLAEGKRGEAEEFLKQAKRELPDDPAAYRMLGDFYFAVNNIDGAMAEYASLYHDHPHDLQVKKNYVQLLIMKNQFEEANKINEDILKGKSQDEDCLTYRGEIQMGEGKSMEAIQTLESVIGSNPDNAVAHYQLGLAFSQLSQWDRAWQETEEAVRIRPYMVDAQRALANLAFQKGDFPGVQTAATKIIALQPASPDGYVLRALSWMARKQLPSAEADARKAIEVAPQAAGGYLAMGNLRSQEQKLSEAESWYRQSLGRDPNSADALQGLIDVYTREKHPEKAIAAARAQISLSPSNSAFYGLLGGVLLETKDYAKAQSALEKAVELNKSNTDAYAKLSRAEAGQSRLDQAVATCKEGLRENPRSATLYLLLGDLEEQKNDREAAKSAYQSALDAKHDDAMAANNLAYLLLETNGNLDLALQLAQTARRALPRSANVADTLGWAFYQKGAYQSAIAMFQEAIRLTAQNNEPDNATFHYHLGLAYAKAEKPVQARQHLERVLKLDPKYTDADSVRKQLAELKS